MLNEQKVPKIEITKSWGPKKVLYLRINYKLPVYFGTKSTAKIYRLPCAIICFCTIVCDWLVSRPLLSELPAALYRHKTNSKGPIKVLNYNFTVYTSVKIIFVCHVSCRCYWANGAKNLASHFNLKNWTKSTRKQILNDNNQLLLSSQHLAHSLPYISPTSIRANWGKQSNYYYSTE